MYAYGELPIGNNHLVYGATQCTRDLSGIYCEECLDAAKNALLTKSHGKRGGSVYYGSCHIRFELALFFIIRLEYVKCISPLPSPSTKPRSVMITAQLSPLPKSTLLSFIEFESAMETD
ncbi:hypothetical protein PRUPE_6G146300 [Prunus persica]|uniref:Uncharacterized protein n=1 Tax=Prunus persica TaxID=3760 RepID=M5W7K5_PRUPE|nr:hypothetical protein PRUPE_6G146300 [Prunus persica]